MLANEKRNDPLPKEYYIFLCSNHFEKSCLERDFKLRFYFIKFQIYLKLKLLCSLIWLLKTFHLVNHSRLSPSLFTPVQLLFQFILYSYPLIMHCTYNECIGI